MELIERMAIQAFKNEIIRQGGNPDLREIQKVDCSVYPVQVYARYLEPLHHIEMEIVIHHDEVVQP